ncbi:MAG TPA: TonB-dependent receptor [Candidatus Polarisedimenticolaceae bacterium]|nr:TonB-dependent receptor [Candidatus Polarisedimenticolaceae bacterium]
MLKTIARVVLGLAVMLACAALPALAQEEKKEEAKKTETPAEEAADKEPALRHTEEVKVTARKREETVQEVPFSVVAPTESELRDLGATTIEDVAANVAGFSVQNLGPGQSQVAMRGVSAGQIVRDQPGVKEQVGIYLDESVVSLSLFTPDIDLFDMSRIEVLRGPQGTLFGSGSLSGTLRYISNQPKLGVLENVGELSGDTATDGGVGSNLKFATNLPIGDASAMRFAGFYTKYGGYIDAVQPSFSVHEDVNDGDRFGGRLSFRFDPTESVSITPRVLYQKVEMDGWNRVDLYNILANPFTTSRPPVTLGEREQFTQIEEPTTDEFLLGDVKIDWKMGPGTLTSITSYTDRDILVVRDATALTGSITGGSDGDPENVYTLNAPLDDATTAKSLTQEFRLASDEGRLPWVVGAFYADSDRDYGQSLLVAGYEDLTGTPTAGSFGASKDVLFFSDLQYDFRQWAVFGELTYPIGDRLELTGGLRWYDYKEDRVQTFDGIFASPGTSTGTTEADGVAPRVMANFRLTDRTRLNAQVSKGFRLGGINDPLNLPLCSDEDELIFGGHPTWEDETLWNYEVGSKSRIMNDRGAFNVAAFYMDIKDLQATVTAGECSSRVIFNVPKAHSAGVELEFELAPTDVFDFAISASYLNAELDSTLISNGVVISGIQEGNRLPTVPEFQAALAATYHFNLGTWAWYTTGVYQHIGSRFTQIGDQAEGFGTVDLLALPNTIGGPLTQSTFTFDPELPAYDLINLRLGFLKNNWDTALYVNNVTDEEARLALDQERGTLARVGYLTNAPRTIGISARVVF